MQWALLSCVLASVVILFTPSGCAHPKATPQEDNKSVQPPVTLEANIEAADDALTVSYTVTNGSSEPILVLDRLWNRRMKAFDPNWAFVEIRGSKALIKRVMEQKPRGLAVERPPVPYGRELAPGAALSGEFTLPLPLKANGSYDTYVMPNAVEQDVDVTGLGFMLAWTTKPTEPVPPSMRLVKNGEETLQPFTYYALDGQQRFLTSAPQALQIKGIAKVPPSQ